MGMPLEGAIEIMDRDAAIESLIRDGHWKLPQND